MKKAILYRISYLVEVDEEEISAHKGKEKFWKLAWGKLPEQEIVLDEQHKAEWQSTSTLYLDPLTMNCGQCARCHGWTTDREKPDPIRGLSNGATVDGELLCDECLPDHHPWAF